MVDTYLLKSLKRVHDEAERAIERDSPQTSASVAERFNEVLAEFQEEHPDKERLQDIESAESITVGSRNLIDGANKALDELQNIKLQCLSIADMFDIDTAEFKEISEDGDMTIISLEQNQSANQAVQMNNLMKQVDQMMVPQSQKQELKDIIEDYENEMQDENPDKSRLRSLVSSAQEISEQVAIKMAVAGLSRGLNLLDLA